MITCCKLKIGSDQDSQSAFLSKIMDTPKILENYKELLNVYINTFDDDVMKMLHDVVFCSLIFRRFWHWHQRLGWWRCPPVQKVPPQQPSGGSSTIAKLVPLVAREALCGRAPSRPVPHVYAVQGHERGIARPAGDAVLQARDRSSPPQTETTKLKPEEDMKIQWLDYSQCNDCRLLKYSRWNCIKGIETFFK